MTTLNLFTPSKIINTDFFPESIRELVLKTSSLEEFERRFSETINQPTLVAALTTTSAAEILNGVAVYVADAEASERIVADYGLPSAVAGQVMAVAAYDEPTGTPHIVLTERAIVLHETDPALFEAILVHELVHIDQMVRGDLEMQLSALTYRWKGQDYSLPTLMHQTQQAIEALEQEHPEVALEHLNVIAELQKPWEEEAYLATAAFLGDAAVHHFHPLALEKLGVSV